MNRESLPLIVALMIPLLLVLTIFLYNYGIDITSHLRKIPIIYYIVVLPIILGFTVIIVKYAHPD